MTASDLISQRFGSIALAAYLFASLGCGRSDWGYVTGSVTVDGSPVGPGTVVFQPLDPDRVNGPSSLGYFDASGKYKLVSVGQQDGAPTGKYAVLVMAGSPGSLADESAAPDETASPIPSKYTEYDSGLTASVKPGSQVIDFPLAN